MDEIANSAVNSFFGFGATADQVSPNYANPNRHCGQAAVPSGWWKRSIAEDLYFKQTSRSFPHIDYPFVTNGVNSFRLTPEADLGDLRPDIDKLLEQKDGVWLT